MNKNLDESPRRSESRRIASDNTTLLKNSRWLPPRREENMKAEKRR
jgi:hypothetical protein